MCIRDRYQRRVRGNREAVMASRGYFQSTIPEALRPHIRRPELGSRIVGLVNSLAHQPDLGYGSPMATGMPPPSPVENLARIEAEVEMLRRDQAAAANAWASERNAMPPASLVPIHGDASWPMHARADPSWVPAVARQAAADRVDALEVSLSRENHARGYAVKARASQEMSPCLLYTSPSPRDS
eukprot:TRINITY_DN5604_c0_g1_i2.p1 TRINITY_DN5604_c0_g1~~TRINITY_DN5604_c0_g1_i2.p1  ORF type:complete len:184 (+),score=35.30 TRINITY_DN5604_c0_g1_i2:155-706(+)